MKRVRKIVGCAMAAALLLQTVGCSLFAPWSEEVLIDSDPQGAEVVVPGHRLTTPATVTVPCDKDLTVVVRKEGFRTQSSSVRRTLGKCGVLDVVGTVLFIVPAVGLFSPGAYTLDHHTVFFVLEKKPAD